MEQSSFGLNSEILDLNLTLNIRGTASTKTDHVPTFHDFLVKVGPNPFDQEGEEDSISLGIGLSSLPPKTAVAPQKIAAAVEKADNKRKQVMVIDDIEKAKKKQKKKEKKQKREQKKEKKKRKRAERKQRKREQTQAFDQAMEKLRASLEDALAAAQALTKPNPIETQTVLPNPNPMLPNCVPAAEKQTIMSNRRPGLLNSVPATETQTMHPEGRSMQPPPANPGSISPQSCNIQQDKDSFQTQGTAHPTMLKPESSKNPNSPSNFKVIIKGFMRDDQ